MTPKPCEHRLRQPTRRTGSPTEDYRGEFLRGWLARRRLLTELHPIGPDPLAEWVSVDANRDTGPRLPNRTNVRTPDLDRVAVYFTDIDLRSLGVLVVGLELYHVLEYLNDHSELRIGRRLAAMDRRGKCDPLEQLAAVEATFAVLRSEVQDAAPRIMYEAWRRPMRVRPEG